MKKIAPLLLLMLMLSACVSTSLEGYQHATVAEINAKRHANNASQADMYNRWHYAGSDDKYDYIYEFKPGIFLSPPSNFHYYKLDKGQLDIEGRYPFHPDVKQNTDILDW